MLTIALIVVGLLVAWWVVKLAWDFGKGPGGGFGPS